MIAAILRPRFLGVARIERPLFAVADRANARSVDAERGEVILRRLRAAVAESEVVLLGAAFVAMAFDEQVVLRILFEPIRGRLKRRLRIGGQRRIIEREK